MLSAKLESIPGGSALLLGGRFTASSFAVLFVNTRALGVPGCVRSGPCSSCSGTCVLGPCQQHGAVEGSASENHFLKSCS